MQIVGITALCVWAFMALVSLALTIRFVVIMVAFSVMMLRESSARRRTATLEE
jgi:Flp pilus assembly protein TadB